MKDEILKTGSNSEKFDEFTGGVVTDLIDHFSPQEQKELIDLIKKKLTAYYHKIAAEKEEAFEAAKTNLKSFVDGSGGS